MPSKTEEYLALAQRTANGLTRYWESWTDYLTTASRLYKYPFADQLMIYAQRPDATACADFDIWNNRMNRYVRRGAKGIALLDESRGFPRLHYVFDVSDTGVRRNSRDPEVWQYNDDLKQPVSEMLAATYGISGERVSQQLADIAGKLVADYWDNNGGDIRAIVDGSLLMDYDEAGVEMQFKSAAAISVTYTLLERCGFEPAGWFDKDDFQAIYNFSTPDSVYTLGAAVSDMSREVLRNIERTVKTTIRRRNAERSQYEYEQQERDLLDRRGLPAPEPDPEPAPEAAGQVRQAAPDVPEGASPGAVQLDRGATAEEQQVLSQYVGWGGLSDAFDPGKDSWAKEYAELKGLLSEDEYVAARSSTLNAHYTSPTVIRGIYDAVERMGFRSGNILEPSMGVGNFFGMLPDTMQDSRLYGVELDSITGRIAKKLYPQADITVAGFETTDRRDFYDLAVGNVPFGNYKVNDKAYNKLGFSIHNYFFAKAIDQVRPGGVVAFVTSRYTMDSKDSTARKHMAERADLLGAIRLPNNAFRANAGTDVVSDIIFLQKRDRPIDHEPDWVQLGKTEDGFAINQYFVDHPEMVLGEMTTESTQYGREEFTVAPLEGTSLADQLAEAVQHIEGQYTEVEVETPDIADAENEKHILPADPDVKNFSYTVVDGEVFYRENSVMTQVELSDTAKGRVTGMVELRQIVNDLIDQQLNDFPDEDIKATQERLNAAYDAFTAKYGLLNDRKNGRLFEQDSSYYLLCSLENLDEQGQLKSKAAMFTKRTIRPERTVTSVDTPSEALAVSIGEHGKVDLPYIQEVSFSILFPKRLDIRKEAICQANVHTARVRFATAAMVAGNYV